MSLIGDIFPYLLGILLPFVVIFHPVQAARAVLFFIFGYFITEALYSVGLFEAHGSRYHPLIFASAMTVILYHSLDITLHILAAWIIEVFLIALNAAMIWGLNISPSVHWDITVALNLFSLLILLGGWSHGTGRLVYSRWYSLDIPLGCLGSQYCFVDKKS